MSTIPYAPPNIGFQAALSTLGTVPTSTNVVGDVMSVTGVKITVNTTDATTITSTDGYTRSAPTTKTASPMTVTLWKENTTYETISAFINASVTDQTNFPCRLTIVYPKVTSVNDTVPNYSYDGFISELGNSDGEANGIQTVNFVFTPVGAPIVFAGTL